MMRKHHSPQFKTRIVLEILSGEKELNAVCTENNLNPNMVGKWRQEFLENAHNIFDTKSQNKETTRKEQELKKSNSNEYSSVRELKDKIAKHVIDYNTQRPHESLEYYVPDDYFYGRHLPQKPASNQHA